MADSRTILNHYNISTAFPTEWPAEKDLSDESDTEPKSQARSNLKSNVVRTKSRYSVLERNVSERKSLVPGSEKTRDGVETLVLRDEPDALGSTDSVVRTLRRKGLPVEEDDRFRKTSLLGSNRQRKLNYSREQIFALFYNIYTSVVSLPGPFRCIY